MENWKVINKGYIPKGKYLAELKNGEEEGLIILLESNEYSVKMDFGLASAVRMFDEGILLQEGIFDEEQIVKYKKDNFSNTIYKIVDGEFGNEVKKISGEMYDVLNLEHYLIITLNYVIEVISQGEPEINVIPIDDNMGVE
ncbi:hypothetical protein CE91St62_22920 [Lachnospiraceae bacterium]|uniref:hypothetical protein n=1 Tax=Extibacter sp. GGCC_0201 TaxID=2731209 RepID=UPI001AA19E88|nr:hypothetical protein [Extibacter sp. GGCC_0201]MBO1719100.1 hypothetical protein [Extibacter sp. GGCC_0201]BDF34227.1 hypothetical protein CE91St61_23020 [Lachnospiraceae bacterium]BDF38231.1 hypothetical protein CE91St62_22920 [Lachnospiraceae bacterium]